VEHPTAPYFTNVKVHTCKLAWDRLSDEQKAYEVYLKTATSIAPEEMCWCLMEELYHLKQTSNEAAVVAREERT